MEEQAFLERYRLQIKDEKYYANVEAEGTLKQPLAAMVLSGLGFDCKLEDDGTEVFSNGKCIVRVPPGCVEWIKPPTIDPTAEPLTAEERARFNELNTMYISTIK